MTKDLKTLFVAHGPELRVYLTRQLRDPHTAADLLQETFLRFASGQRRDSISNPRAFLYRIAGNLALDRLRQNKFRAQYQAEEESAADVPAPEPPADAVVSSRQELGILTQAIDELPPKCRQVFLLYRVDGLPMRAVAVRLGISEKTVEKHIAKAMVHCRRRLTAAGRAF